MTASQIRAATQRGDKTQIQGQVITLQSLRTIKATPSSPKKPIPPLEFDELLIFRYSQSLRRKREQHSSI